MWLPVGSLRHCRVAFPRRLLGGDAARRRPTSLAAGNRAAAPGALVASARGASSNPLVRPANLVGHARSSLKRTKAMRVAQIKSAEEWLLAELGVSAERAEKIAPTFAPMWVEMLPRWQNWLCVELQFTRHEAIQTLRKSPILLNSRTEKADAVLA